MDTKTKQLIYQFNDSAKRDGTSDRIIPNNLFAPLKLKIRHHRDDGYQIGEGYFMYNLNKTGLIDESIYFQEQSIDDYVW